MSRRVALAVCVALALVPSLTGALDIPEVDLEGAQPAVIRVISEARTEVQESPGSADAWGSLGIALDAHGFRDAAVASYQRAAAIDGSNPQWVYLNAVAVERSAPEESRDLLDRAIELGAGGEAAHWRRGELALRLGDLPAARKSFEIAQSLSPNSPWPRIGLARCYLVSGEVEVALEQLREAQRRTPRLRDTHSLLSQAYARLGDAELSALHASAAELLADRERLVPPDPVLSIVFNAGVSSRWHVRRAQIALERGDSAEAEREVRSALNAVPEEAVLLADLGATLVGTGDISSALEVLARAVEIDGENLVARLNLGGALVAADRRDEARAELDKVLDLDPRSIKALLNLAALADADGDEDEARRRLLMVLDRAPAAIDANLRLAEFDAAERLPAAILRWRTVTELDPTRLDVWRRLATALAQDCRFDESVEALENAALAGGGPEVLSPLAWHLATAPDEAARDGDRAVEIGEKLAASYAAHPQAHDILAAALAESGNFELAEQIARRAYALAHLTGDLALAELIRERGQGYGRGVPFRQTTESCPKRSGTP